MSVFWLGKHFGVHNFAPWCHTAWTKDRSLIQRIELDTANTFYAALLNHSGFFLFSYFLASFLVYYVTW